MLWKWHGASTGRISVRDSDELNVVRRLDDWSERGTWTVLKGGMNDRWNRLGVFLSWEMFDSHNLPSCPHFISKSLTFQFGKTIVGTTPT